MNNTLRSWAQAPLGILGTILVLGGLVLAFQVGGYLLGIRSPHLVRDDRRLYLVKPTLTGWADPIPAYVRRDGRVYYRTAPRKWAEYQAPLTIRDGFPTDAPDDLDPAYR